MPIRVDAHLPAVRQLVKEQVLTMEEGNTPSSQNGTVRLLIVNLMPTKEVTETQLLRLLANNPLQVEILFLRMRSYQSRHASPEHLRRFYKTLDDVRDEQFDGMIITGAPVEHLPFEEVAYWSELSELMDWGNAHVASTFYICWGAQAGLYHHYGIKCRLPKKLFGVFSHTATSSGARLLRGLDDVFYLPHSRHTSIRKEDIAQVDELEVLVDSPEAGVSLLQSRDGRHVFITGHAEYDADTLEKEYQRDLDLGRSIELPSNYYPGDNPAQQPQVRWRSTAHLLFSNWLHFYVNKETRNHSEKGADENDREKLPI